MSSVYFYRGLCVLFFQCFPCILLDMDLKWNCTQQFAHFTAPVVSLCPGYLLLYNRWPPNSMFPSSNRRTVFLLIHFEQDLMGMARLCSTWPWCCSSPRTLAARWFSGISGLLMLASEILAKGLSQGHLFHSWDASPQFGSASFLVRLLDPGS